MPENNFRPFYWLFAKALFKVFSLVSFLAFFKAPEWVIASVWLASSYYFGCFQLFKIVGYHALSVVFQLLAKLAAHERFQRFISAVVLIAVLTSIRVWTQQSEKRQNPRAPSTLQSRTISPRAEIELRKALPGATEARIQDLIYGAITTPEEERILNAYVEARFPASGSPKKEE